MTSPPKGLDGYRERAAATAAALRSEVETASLWARTRAAGRATAAATLVGFEEAERDATAAASTFEGFEPPEGADALRSSFVTLASQATEALAGLRIAARRERWGEIPRLGSALPGLSLRLSGFEERAEP